MWIVLGVGAILFALLNVGFTLKKKNIKWFGFISLSLTALTLCAFNSMNADLVINKDWSSLMDTVPTMSKALWILTVVSIAINSISLWKINHK